MLRISTAQRTNARSFGSRGKISLGPAVSRSATMISTSRAAALIIFGPLLMPVAVKLGIDPLHFGVVLVVAMGIGLFAPPLGLGLYGACLIGNVPIEQTVKPIMGYLGLLLLCLLVIAFVPAISTALPRAFGY